MLLSFNICIELRVSASDLRWDSFKKKLIIKAMLTEIAVMMITSIYLFIVNLAVIKLPTKAPTTVAISLSPEFNPETFCISSSLLSDFSESYNIAS
jgi:hypothetical protein